MMLKAPLTSPNLASCWSWALFAGVLSCTITSMRVLEFPWGKSGETLEAANAILALAINTNIPVRSFI
jgi:hypothetical protein